VSLSLTLVSLQSLARMVGKYSPPLAPVAHDAWRPNSGKLSPHDRDVFVRMQSAMQSYQDAPRHLTCDTPVRSESSSSHLSHSAPARSFGSMLQTSSSSEQQCRASLRVPTPTLRRLFQSRMETRTSIAVTPESVCPVDNLLESLRDAATAKRLENASPLSSIAAREAFKQMLAIAERWPEDFITWPQFCQLFGVETSPPRSTDLPPQPPPTSAVDMVSPLSSTPPSPLSTATPPSSGRQQFRQMHPLAQPMPNSEGSLVSAAPMPVPGRPPPTPTSVGSRLAAAASPTMPSREWNPERKEASKEELERQWKAEMYKRSLAVCEETLGNDHPYTAMEASRLATVYAEQGRTGDAHSLVSSAVRVCAKELQKELQSGSSSDAAHSLLQFDKVLSEHGPSQPNNGSVKLLEDVHKAVELDNVIIAQVMSNLIITVATLQSGAAIAKDSQMPLVAALPG